MASRIDERTDEITRLLPLELIRSQKIPPSPNRFESAVDWLPDFGGLSWIAYGASSLLVISHFPSPISQEETLIGTIFFQVIEPLCSRDVPAIVKAVAWSPSIPSDGEIAVGLGNSLCVYSSGPENKTGSFCWRQVAGLVHSSTIEAIKWTGSGDGLITVGVDVVLWRKNKVSWEIAWKSTPANHQNLVSTTWSIKGLAATAAHFGGPQVEDMSSTSMEARKRVLVYYSDGTSDFFKVELSHPQPISMIQWRPSILRKDARDTQRDMLLTCCLDGTARLWCEIDNGRARKPGEGVLDQKRRQPFHVTAVIEVNQMLKGTLGIDTYVQWATELNDKRSKRCFTTEESKHDMVGKCEWLIGVGPEMSLSLWAVHCLDDTSPVRFPRVTLCRKHVLPNSKVAKCVTSSSSNPKLQPILVKAVISRSRVYGPPTMCSLLQLLPGDIISWSQLYSQVSNSGEVGSSNQPIKENLSGFAGGFLDQVGHTGKILQVALHPYRYEVEVAVSLDSNGMLLFWSLSTISNPILGKQTLFHPTMKLLGRIVTGNLSTGVNYTTLKWAPSVFDDDLVLLMGHAGGIDCFIIKISQCSLEDKILFHKICTIPSHGCSRSDGPDHIFATSLPSTCDQNIISNSFLLLGIWVSEFQALSWKVVMQASDLSGSIDKPKGLRQESTFGSRKYYVVADPCSSKFPYPHDSDKVTSFSVIFPDSMILSSQPKASAYNLATGCFDGSLKLWRIATKGSSFQNVDQMLLPWELVGMYIPHQGPVTAICLSNCGSKIATLSISPSDNISNLFVWESNYLVDKGSFLIEDIITLNGIVIAIEWQTLGNGQLLLGVCMEDELRIYAPKRFSGQILVESRKSMEMHLWVCAAIGRCSSPARNFLWGPRFSLILVHDTYLCLFSQWAFCKERKELVMDVEDELIKPTMSFPVGDYEFCDISFKMSEKYESTTRHELHNILEIVEKLCGPLPVYHPDALFLCLSSGYWKQAYAAVKHLVGYLDSDENVGKCVKGQSFGHPSIPHIQLSQYLDELPSANICDRELQWGSSTSLGTAATQLEKSSFPVWGGSLLYGSSESISNAATGESERSAFVRTLEKLQNIEIMTNPERIQLLALVDLLDEVRDSCYASTYGSFDEPGKRFWVSVRFQQLYFLRKNGRLAAFEELIIDSGLTAWAFQSDCQESLLSSLLSPEPSWLEMRKLGVGYWFADAAQLRTRMEKLARSQYLKKRDPKDCAILYIALNRLKVLAGLFKLSKDERDKPLFGFLSRNFQEERNKAAALKNAFVLMGKHQLELAVAFFLLGGDISSAVNVCAKNLGDEQLALVICRLLEGHGGALERHLISSFLLPSAIERGDNWLVSSFEWALGNYEKSFWSLLSLQIDPPISMLPTRSYIAFSDPNIGRYCALLAVKNTMKNSVGECTSDMMAKWAMMIASNALKRCGLPLEALEYLMSSLGSLKSKYQVTLSDTEKPITNVKQTQSTLDSSNWVLGDTASHLEAHSKLGLAMRHISQLIREHPSWPGSNSICRTEHYEPLLKIFEHKLKTAISILEKKYSIEPLDFDHMILVFASNNGLLFLGSHILHGNSSGEHLVDKRLYHLLLKLFLKESKEVCHLLVRYIVASSITCSERKPLIHPQTVVSENISGRFRPWDFCIQDLVHLIENSEPLLKFYGSGFSTDALTEFIFTVFDLLEYCVYFATAWAQRKSSILILMIRPILNEFKDGHRTELKAADLKSLLNNLKMLGDNAFNDGEESSPDAKLRQGKDGQNESMMPSLPEDESWRIIGVCLWRHLSKFFNTQLNMLTEEGSQDKDFLVKLLKSTLAYIYCCLSKQLELHLRQKVENGVPVPTLVWLEETSRSITRGPNSYLNHRMDRMEIDKESETYFIEKLWRISVDPKEVREDFAWREINLIRSISPNSYKSWTDFDKSILPVHGSDETLNHVPGATGAEKWKNREATCFDSPKEIYKRNGELVEAMCVNSIVQKQVALASNRKGLIFYNWEVNKPIQEQAEYIWAESDWPQNGWAGSESTPIPTFVSRGVGLGSEKGTHLGLGGATIGVGSLARPGRDLTGGGAFGIPGYAGIGASGLGWDEPGDFDEFEDPPATVENVRTRALASHPSRPFFLVGSSNTHVYLWEFGKERATATYGVLPAANVPPPYALASISALQFDVCGHRFATAALDGTVCTWQVEVGGRSNVGPTESSLCFNGHASDVAYVAASGSVIAVAGYSTNGVNVVVWDTLAPPATSQASLTCHEGGARSISVFDNDIGSGSISPMIVTGGKGGDVGLHDFRFIATGRTKRHKQSSSIDEKQSSEHQNGMLWHIPKAHQGSVTRISTIPNTSLFLTGSKDGDVKLWDAKRQEPVFHWQKLHERHTFLQPSSRGFGGIVRAAVTDIQVLSHGFITCGGDGTVKLVQLRC